MKRIKSERGTALLEAAITIPLLLLVAVGIFEFGRAYQTWQVLTNAAREGARVAILPFPVEGAAEGRVRAYMQDGGLPGYAAATVNVNQNATVVINGTNVSASQVTIGYPFEFIVLQPIAKLVNPNSTTGSALTMQASAVMRNEQ